MLSVIPGMKTRSCKFMYFAALLLLSMSAGPATAQTTSGLKLLDVRKIWDEAPHSAFTDLVSYRGKLVCAFREAGRHVPKNHAQDGKIRLIESEDGTTWSSLAVFSKPGLDLRDPKLSVTSDNRLMVLIGGSTYENGKLLHRQPYVTFSQDGKNFGELKQVTIDPQISNNDWLWRVTWHGDKAYGTVYNAGPEFRLHLVSSTDGTSYSLVKSFDLTGSPNEASVAFLPGGDMIFVVRRESGSQMGMIGRAAPPFTDWQWKEMNVRLGGPALLVTGEDSVLMGTREYITTHTTVLGKLSLDGVFTKLLDFPSGGDTSYPGLVLQGDKLFMSYYSSHEGKTSIYLARIETDGKVR